MQVKTVAIMSPGDMGHAVGRTLAQGGLDVITCLQGRSERTRGLAGIANIRNVASFEELVVEADLILSILVPAEAESLASTIARALKRTGADTYYAECNAVSPRTTLAMNDVIGDAGGRYVDGSIIGGPPGRGKPPRFYVSGPHAPVMSELDGKGIDVRPLGEEVGRASGIKMCYAALTKGTFTLQMALLTAAEAMGLSGELRAEFSFSQTAAYGDMESRLPGLSSKASRWIGEMEEIAATFEGVGVTPHFHLGAAAMCRLLSETPFAAETAETIDRTRTLDETISELARLLPSGVQTAD